MSDSPLDFRRVTMMVNEIDTPLKIYRDILGMGTFYDEEFVVEGNKLPSGVKGAKCRLVILKGNDPYIGMLGILCCFDPPLPATPPRPEPNRVQAGEIVFVMHHEDVDGVYEQLKDVEGVQIVSEPVISGCSTEVNPPMWNSRGMRTPERDLIRNSW